MLQSMLNQIDHVMIGASESGDEKFLQYLGMTQKQLSGKGLTVQRVNGFVSVCPGKFMYYKEEVDGLAEPVPRRLVLCLSKLNPANECFVLMMKRTVHSVLSSELKRTTVVLDVGVDGYVKFAGNDIGEFSVDGSDIKQHDVVEWTNKENDRKQLLVVEDVNLNSDENPDRVIKCAEYTAAVRVVSCNSESCILLEQGNKGCLRVQSMDPPSKFQDNGSFDRKDVAEFNVCYCTFLAMFQREVSMGDTQLSIKRYFCNNPVYQSKRIRWRVFCGRIVDIPTSEDSNHIFIEKNTVKWVTDRYVGDRLNVSERTVAGSRDVEISNGLYCFPAESSCIFVNIFIVLHHWVRHDASKGPIADELLWRLDREYYPYDSFYRPSFEGAEKTLLRTYDFTISQCLKIWVHGVFEQCETIAEIMPHSKFDSFFEDCVQRYMCESIEELNQMLDGFDTLPDPIFAGLDSTDHENYDAFKIRAKQIIKHAVSQAFPFLPEQDKLFFEPSSFVRRMVDLYLDERKSLLGPGLSRPNERKSLSRPSLSMLSIAALIGQRFGRDEPGYDAMISLRCPIRFPSLLKPNRVILIFDEEGVTVATFIFISWMESHDSLKSERKHRADRDGDGVFWRSGCPRFDMCIPLIHCSLNGKDPRMIGMKVRDLFNVYTLGINGDGG